MDTLDNNISNKNRVPGSGCDSFTRPEEIKALGKFLSQLKEAYVDSTQLETEITGVPGRTTGKFPDLSLENSVESLDLSREEKLRELSSKLVSLDNSFSQNLDGKLEHLPDTILKIDEDPIQQLSQRLISLSEASKEEINLSDKKENLEVSDKDIKLSETKDRLEVKDEIKLDEEVVRLKTESSTELEDTKLGLDINSDIELNNGILSINTNNEIDLENTKLSLDIDSSTELENTKLNLDTNSEVELNNTVQDLKVESSTELENTKLNLNINSEVELNNTIQDLKVESSIDLENTKLGLDTNSEVELGNTILNLNTEEEIDLENTKLNLDIDSDIDLGDIKIKLDADSNPILQETKLNLEVEDNIGLDESILNLETEEINQLESEVLNLDVERENNLEDHIIRLSIDSTTDLSETKLQLETEDIIDELGDLLLSLDIDDSSFLEDNILGLSVNSNIDLESDILSLDPIVEPELEDKILNLDVEEDSALENSVLKLETKSDTNLEDTKLGLSIEDNIELEESKLSLDVNPEIELGDTKLNLETNSDIELGSNILKLEKSEEISLEDTIDSLFSEFEITDLTEKKISLSPESQEPSQLSEKIDKIGDIKDPTLYDEFDKEKIIGDLKDSSELGNTKLSPTIEGEIGSLKDKPYNFFGDNETTLPYQEALDLLKYKSPDGDNNYEYFEPDGGTLYDSILTPAIEGEIGSLKDKPYNFFGDDETKLPYSGVYTLGSAISGEINRGDSSYEWDSEDSNLLLYGSSVLEHPITIREGNILREGQDYSYFNTNKYKDESQDSSASDLLYDEDGYLELGSVVSGNRLSGEEPYSYINTSAESDTTKEDIFYSEELELSSVVGGNRLSDEKPYSYINIEENSDITKDTLYSNSDRKKIIVDVSLDEDGNIAERNNLFIETLNLSTSSEKDMLEHNPGSDKWSLWENAEKNIFKSAEIEDIINNNTEHSEFVSITESPDESSKWNIWMERLKSKLNGKIVDHLRYKLPDFDPHVGSNYDINSYIRWAAEELIEGMDLTGDLRKAVLDELIHGFITTRTVTEKLLETNKDRLPGQPLLGNLSNLVSDGIGPKNLIKTVGNSISDALSSETDKPMNRPSKEGNTTGWVKANSDIPVLADSESDNSSSDSKKGFWKKLLDTTLTRNSPEENYKFKNAYLMGRGIETTITDLVDGSEDSKNESGFAKIQNGSLESFYDLLKTSPYMTTAEKVTSTGNGIFNTTSLDSNTHWEVVFEPYIGSLNGNYTFLPGIEEINVRNKELHGVNTKYSRWIPFTAFDLQKEKLVTKSLGLYDGEMSYPTSMEFTNELRMTLVDDQFKSWKTYFERCAYASVYSSTPRETFSNDPIIIDRKYNLVAPYKNISFRCRIYIMTPQKSTITKFDLLLILKDYTIDYTGDIDSAAPDLNLTFSIVGENPPDKVIVPKALDDTNRKNLIEKYQEKLWEETKKELGATAISSLTSTAIKLL